MTTFQVNSDSLLTLSSHLSWVSSQMSGIGEAAAQLSPADLGSLQVYSALQNFHDNWSQGLSTISGNITQMTQLLTGAAQAYGTTDSSIARAAGGTT